MNRYLGEFDIATAERTPQEWALDWITRYGGIDGAHHKDWVLDQVARILHGTPVIVREARWDNGHTELRYRTGEPSQAYHDWVRYLKAGEDGPETYNHSVGIAP